MQAIIGHITSTFALTLILVLFAVVALLVYLTILCRRVYVQQNQKILLQRKVSEIKERELDQISLILESHEIYRKRNAEDLIDFIGNTITAIRLNFEEYASDVRKPEYKAQRISELLSKVYDNVRKAPENKYVETPKTSGLVAAVQSLAKQIGVVGKLKVQVLPFNLKTHMEERIELLLFSVIRELGTNVVEHAQASDLTIYLNEDDARNLTIIVEDNGKGFTFDAVNAKADSGLKKIEKIIEDLGGTFNVDSNVNNGTTIIATLKI